MSITHRGKDFGWLLVHTVMYFLAFFSGMMIGVLFFGYEVGMVWKFSAIIIVIHFFTDFCLGKISSHFWEIKKHRWAFVVMGAEQFIHIAMLICVFQLLN